MAPNSVATFRMYRITSCAQGHSICFIMACPKTLFREGWRTRSLLNHICNTSKRLLKHCESTIFPFEVLFFNNHADVSVQGGSGRCTYDVRMTGVIRYTTSNKCCCLTDLDPPPKELVTRKERRCMTRNTSYDLPVRF